jgi:hypothetical protein
VIIEISVVDAHSPLASFLGYKHRVGEPYRVLTFTDESAAKSFKISTLMTSLRSFAKRQSFCLIGLAVLLTSRSAQPAPLEHLAYLMGSMQICQHCPGGNW